MRKFVACAHIAIYIQLFTIAGTFHCCTSFIHIYWVVVRQFLSMQMSYTDHNDRHIMFISLTNVRVIKGWSSTSTHTYECNRDWRQCGKTVDRISECLKSVSTCGNICNSIHDSFMIVYVDVCEWWLASIFMYFSHF